MGKFGRADGKKMQLRIMTINYMLFFLRYPSLWDIGSVEKENVSHHIRLCTKSALDMPKNQEIRKYFLTGPFMQ